MFINLSHLITTSKRLFQVPCGLNIWNLSTLLENPFGALTNEQQDEFNNLLCIFQELPKTFSLHQGKSMSNRLKCWRNPQKLLPDTAK